MFITYCLHHLARMSPAQGIRILKRIFILFTDGFQAPRTLPAKQAVGFNKHL